MIHHSYAMTATQSLCIQASRPVELWTVTVAVLSGALSWAVLAVALAVACTVQRLWRSTISTVVISQQWKRPNLVAHHGHAHGRDARLPAAPIWMLNNQIPGSTYYFKLWIPGNTYASSYDRSSRETMLVGLHSL